MTSFPADFRPGDRTNPYERGPGFPGLRGEAPSARPRRALGARAPAPRCYSGLGAQGGAAGRRRRWGGAAEARRRHPRGAGRRGDRTPPGEETRQVWLRRRVPAGRRLAPPPTNTTTQPRPCSSAPSPPCEPQLSVPLPLPLPARRRPRRPTPARRPRRARSGRDGPGGEARPRDPSAPPARSRVWASPGSPSPSRSGAARPRVCLGAERRSECSPT